MSRIVEHFPTSAETTPAKNPESAKVAEYAMFDVLRFLLASAVMLSHLGVIPWRNAGNLAVQVFFALSGWLIGSILYRTTAGELSRFYFNRATRIWIPYYATVLALYLVSLLHEPVRSARWLEFLTYDVTFTHNLFSLWPDANLALSEMPLRGTGNHFWSIAVEEQFYLIAPLLMTLLPFGRKFLPWILIAVIAVLTRSLYASISLGVLFAVLANIRGNWHLRSVARIALIALAGVSAASMMMPQAYDFAAPAFSVAVVLLCAVPMERNAVTRWVGGVSFPLYLTAWMGAFVLHAVTRHFNVQEGWYSLPIEYLCSLGGAAIFYQLIDRTVMTNRDRFYTAPFGWALGVAGYTLVSAGIVYWIVRVQ
jgi:peptidoglycan/LPS O-acetylase OafA/YrhL